MNNISEFITHWWNRNNCFTRDFIIEIFNNVVDNKPLWENDQLCYDIYKKEIKKIQKRNKVHSLDYIEEQKLIELKCNGDSEAFNKLVYSQLPYVIHIARKYQNLGLQLNDLISEGNLGLIKAIEKIEPRGFRVSTYTQTYIRNHIHTAIDKYGSQVYYPINILQNTRRVLKAIDVLELKNGCRPSYEEIAEVCNIDIEFVDNIMSCINFEISIDQLSAYFGDSFILDDYINSVCNPYFNFSDETIDEDLYKKSMEIEIDNSCGRLSDREYKIIKMFFGIGCKKKKLQEIANKLDLTQERVRQINENAIKKLKMQKLSQLREYLS